MGIKRIIKRHRRIMFDTADPIIAEKAAELRAQYGITTPDAIQFAIGIENNGTLFVTNDKNLKKIKEIEVLAEYL
ncbi:MAG: PIN domain-containing protein [bacterium]